MEPFAVGIITAAEQVSADVSSALTLGELALDGSTRPVTASQGVPGARLG